MPKLSKSLFNPLNKGKRNAMNIKKVVIDKPIIWLVIWFAPLISLSGCGTVPKEPRASLDQNTEEMTTAVEPSAGGSEDISQTDESSSMFIQGAAPAGAPDSLWSSDSAYASLFVSQKAHHVGDIVTIRIVESSSASNQATTSTGRDSSLSISTPNFFGAESEVPQEWLFNPLGQLGASFGSDFDGEGATRRSGDLTAYITAKITEVFPNGNLKISGTREVAINNEKQFIHLSGVIRSRDISTNNVILSTYIADAKIEYSGDGVVNDRQKPGWLSNLFNKLWPF